MAVNSIDVLLATLARPHALVLRRVRMAWAGRFDPTQAGPRAAISGWAALAADGPRSVEEQIALKKVLGYCREVLGDRRR